MPGVAAAYELPAEMKIDPELDAKIKGASIQKSPETSPSHHEEFLSYVGAKRQAVSPSPRADNQAHTVLLILAVGKNDPSTPPKHVVAKWNLELSQKLKFSPGAIELVSPQKAVLTVTGLQALKGAVDLLVQQPLLHWRVPTLVIIVGRDGSLYCGITHH